MARKVSQLDALTGAQVDTAADYLPIIDASAASTTDRNKRILVSEVAAALNALLDHGTLTGRGDDDHTQYHTDARALTWLGTRSTADLPEGANLYYTEARVNTWLATKDTDDLAEGANLYFTNERAQDAVGAILTDSASVDFTYNDGAGTITAVVLPAGVDHGGLAGLADDDHTQYHTDGRALTWLGTRSTADLPEGANLYYTAERAQDAVGGILTDSASVDFTYDDGAGTITAVVLPAGVDHGGLAGLADDDHPQYVLHTEVDDTPVNGATTDPISSNWAFDHVADADPHTVYRLESADHNHQSSGAQGGKLDHGLALDGLGDDDHTQYHTDGRALTWLGTRSTADLPEGANLYYTAERAQDAVGGILTDSGTIDFTYDDGAGTITAIVIDDSITYAKLQNVSATDRLLGRVTAGAGNVEEIEISDFVQTLLNDATAAAARTTLGAADASNWVWVHEQAGANFTAQLLAAIATGATHIKIKRGGYTLTAKATPSGSQIIEGEGGFTTLITKAFNGDMFDLSASNCQLKGLWIDGDGATYTGRAVVIETASSFQKMIDCYVDDVNGYALEFEDENAGQHFEAIDCHFRRTTASNPAVKLPTLGAAEDGGNRGFFGCRDLGGDMIDFADGSNTKIVGGSFAGLTFGTWCNRILIVGNRWAENSISITGDDITIVGNTIAATDITLEVGAERVYVGLNSWSGLVPTFTDNGTNNRIWEAITASTAELNILDGATVTAAELNVLDGFANTAYAVVVGSTGAGQPIQSIAGVGTAGQVLTSNGAGAKPTFQAAAGAVGSVINSAYAEYTANANLTTTIPVDDTIPQNTEGTEILTVTITPSHVNNKLRVRFQGMWSVSTTPIDATVALFQDTTANALAATGRTLYDASFNNVMLECEFAAGTTSATTLKIRVGPGTAATLRFNGTTGSRYYGGVQRTTLVVEEIKV